MGKPSDELQEISMIPLLDEKNEIVGTQLVVDRKYFYKFKNSAETGRRAGMPGNPLVEKLGYKLYRDKFDGSYQAVLAYCKLGKNVLDESGEADQGHSLTPSEKTAIIEECNKSILNSIICDQMHPQVRRKQQFADQTAFLECLKIGQPIEAFDWFSMVSLQGIKSRLENIIMLGENVEREEHTYEAQLEDMHYYSLIQRILLDDRRYPNPHPFVTSSGQEYDFDREKCFAANGMYIIADEVLQRDYYFNTPMHYLFESDKQMEYLLSYVFENEATQTNAL